MLGSANISGNAVDVHNLRLHSNVLQCQLLPSMLWIATTHSQILSVCNKHIV